MLKERTQAYHLADREADEDDQAGQEDGNEELQRRIRMLHEEVAYESDIPGQEEVMQEIDIERPAPNKLQVTADDRLAGHMALMLAEESQDHHDAQGTVEGKDDRIGMWELQQLSLEHDHGQEGQQNQSHDVLVVHGPVELVVVLLDQRSEAEENVIPQIEDSQIVVPVVHHLAAVFPRRGQTIDSKSDEQHEQVFLDALVPEGIKDHGERIDEEELEQGQGEPVAILSHIQGFLGDMSVLEEPDEQEEEEHGGDNLHHELLGEEVLDEIPIPGSSGLVQHPTADEEEQRHAEIHKDRIETDHILDRIRPIAIGTDMGKDDEYHGEATHGIDVLDSLFLLR